MALLRSSAGWGQEKEIRFLRISSIFQFSKNRKFSKFFDFFQKSFVVSLIIHRVPLVDSIHRGRRRGGPRTVFFRWGEEYWRGVEHFQVEGGCGGDIRFLKKWDSTNGQGWGGEIDHRISNVGVRVNRVIYCDSIKLCSSMVGMTKSKPQIFDFSSSKMKN